MTIQIRPMTGGTPYAPSRDVAHCWSSVIKEVASRLERQPHPFIAQMLKEHGTKSIDLAEACVTFCHFCATACEDPDEDMAAALRRCGWFDVDPAAQVAFMAFMGQVTAGVFFHGIREATQLGAEISVSYRQLRTAGRRAQILLSLSPWQRFLYLWYRPVRRFYRRWKQRLLTGK